MTTKNSGFPLFFPSPNIGVPFLFRVFFLNRERDPKVPVAAFIFQRWFYSLHIVSKRKGKYNKDLQICTKNYPTNLRKAIRSSATASTRTTRHLYQHRCRQVHATWDNDVEKCPEGVDEGRSATILWLWRASLRPKRRGARRRSPS
jgi:hypothetical protein